MSTNQTLHRSDVFFLRKFINLFQNNNLHKLKGEEFDKNFEIFIKEMREEGEYPVEFNFLGFFCTIIMTAHNFN